MCRASGGGGGGGMSRASGGRGLRTFVVHCGGVPANGRAEVCEGAANDSPTSTTFWISDPTPPLPKQASARPPPHCPPLLSPRTCVAPRRRTRSSAAVVPRQRSAALPLVSEQGIEAMKRGVSPPPPHALRSCLVCLPCLSCRPRRRAGPCGRLGRRQGRAVRVALAVPKTQNCRPFTNFDFPLRSIVRQTRGGGGGGGGGSGSGWGGGGPPSFFTFSNKPALMAHDGGRREACVH